MMSTPEEVARKAASLSEAAAAGAKIASALIAVDYVYALLATRSELQADGLTFDDEFWSPMQYVGPWIRLVVGQKLGDSMGHSRADSVFQDIRVCLAPLRFPLIARRRTACLDHPTEGFALSVAADPAAPCTRRRRQDDQDREAAPKRARLSAPLEAALRCAPTRVPAAGNRENQEPNSIPAPVVAKERDASRIPCALGEARGRDDAQHVGPELETQGAGVAAAASVEGLAGEEARTLGELLAVVPPITEELDLGRSLDERGGTAGPHDDAIALGLFRLASLARETMGDAAFDSVSGSLALLMLHDRDDGSCGGSRP
eukprot:m51a1_g13609 hypothetical protein (317) ;mRNA; r:722-1672